MQKTINKTISTVFGLVFLFAGAQASFAATPTLIIDPTPTAVTASSATFSVFYNTNGDTLSSVVVRYGLDASLSSQTNTVSPGGTSGTLSFTANGLSTGRKYYFQAFGIGSSQSVSSSQYSFTTTALSTPTVITTPNPTSVTYTSATVSGFYNDNGSALNNLYFDYGTTSNLGSSSAVSIAGSSSTVYATLSGLQPNTQYWYRLVASNQTGPAYGSTYSFTTTNNGGNNGSTCYISSFTSSTNNIASGTPVTLSWSTSNCSYVNISNVGNSLSANSSTVVYPTSTTTYSLNAYGTNGSDARTTTVSVGGNNPGGCRSGCQNPCYTGCGNCWYTTSCGNYYQPQQNYPSYTYVPYSYSTQQPTYQSPVNYYQNPITMYGNQQGVNTSSDVVTSSDSGSNVVYRVVKGTSATAKKATTTTTATDTNSFWGGMLGASAGASGWYFFPHTLLGWLLLILFILIVIIIVRSVFGTKNTHAAHDAHH